MQFALLVLRHAVRLVAARGEDMSVGEIVAAVSSFGCRYIVLTGGEPMLFAEIIPLTQELAALGKHVTIETAGTLHLPVTCDLMSISPKFASSAPNDEEHVYWHARHERTRTAPDVIDRLISDYDFQLKFVIENEQDFLELERFLAAHPNVSPAAVWLMPQGVEQSELASKAEWLAPYCRAQGFQFCPRLQIEWFGSGRGV